MSAHCCYTRYMGGREAVSGERTQGAHRTSGYAGGESTCPDVFHRFATSPQGCAQEHFGITPDLTTMGKVIGGGMPVGAYGGKKEIMKMVAPAGPMYQAGTLSGNPMAMTAGASKIDCFGAGLQP